MKRKSTYQPKIDGFFTASKRGKNTPLLKSDEAADSAEEVASPRICNGAPTYVSAIEEAVESASAVVLQENITSEATQPSLKDEAAGKTLNTSDVEAVLTTCRISENKNLQNLKENGEEQAASDANGGKDVKLPTSNSHITLESAVPALEDNAMEMIRRRMGTEWFDALHNEMSKNYFRRCLVEVNKERTMRKKRVYPPDELMFNCFGLTPLHKIKAVIVGQDPYHQPGQAMGLCFSVPMGIKPPPSLRNMFKELGMEGTQHGDLSSWAEQGVFLLNSLLTVVESQPMAHKNLGWEQFTDRVIDVINERCNGVIFMLWGNAAQKKGIRLNTRKHHVLKAGHPSPLSVRFFSGCQHFSKCNEILKRTGRTEINWALPNR